jgi:hypothetical protein
MMGQTCRPCLPRLAMEAPHYIIKPTPLLACQNIPSHCPNRPIIGVAATLYKLCLVNRVHRNGDPPKHTSVPSRKRKSGSLSSVGT